MAGHAPSDEKRRIESLLVQKFTDDARPLSSGALQRLTEHLVPYSKAQRAEQVKIVLAKLTAGK
jgi:hypothetical protein